MKKITSRFMVLKEIIISHPKNWRDRDLRMLASDIACQQISSHDWNLSNVEYTTEKDIIVRTDKCTTR